MLRIHISKILKDSISSFIPMPVGLAPQQIGSAITYFRRFTCSSLLCLEIDDDDAEETRTKQPKEEFKHEPKPLNVIGIKQQLKGAKSLIDLQNIWVTLSNEAKLNLEISQLKDELKTQLPMGTICPLPLIMESTIEIYSPTWWENRLGNFKIIFVY